MRKSSRGFTVIEVLVAIALTMVVGWLVSLAFNNASQACRGVTATLDYRAKGAAILDMLETDIANTSQYCKSLALPAGDVPHAALACKTVLPRQRSHYHRGATFNTDHGDYRHNVVSVRWQFNPGNPAVAGGGAPSSLYRGVSSTVDLAEDFATYKTNMANADCYAWPGAGVWNLVPNNDGTSNPDFAHNSGGTVISGFLVSHTDIRNFSVVEIGTKYAASDGAGHADQAAVSGEIPRAYRVSFFLTNAPANVKSPRDLGATPTEAEKEALAKYIWEYFDRTIATR